MKKIIWIFLIILISCQSAFATEWVSSDVNLKLKIAKNYIKNENYKPAIQIYEKMIQENQKSDEIIFGLFLSYVWIWDFSKGLNIINILAESSKNDEKIVGFYIEEWNITEDMKKYFRQAEVSSWRNVDVMIEYAKSLYKAGDYYYEYDQDEYFFAYLKAYLTAYLILEEALSIDNKNPDIYFYQWRLLMDINGDFLTAEKKLKQAIRLKKDNFEYFYRLWNAFMHQEKNKEAKQAFLMGIQLNKDYEKLYLNLWNVYFDLWERKKWFDAYNKWLKVCWEMCESFYGNIWNEYFYVNDMVRAKYFYEKALKINPNHENSKLQLWKLTK